mmetsp:Transcript_100968/g.314776  ORF Transcript_100968/g.314776 Transcript_100968/m.314776 type:complete len:265 (+) Transcript_100968:93-887(+)
MWFLTRSSVLHSPGAALLAGLLLSSFAGIASAERVSIPSSLGQGSNAKLAQPELIMAGGGEQLLQDSFSDLHDEFDELPTVKSDSISSTSAEVALIKAADEASEHPHPGSSLTTTKAIMLVLIVAIAGGSFAVASQHCEDASEKMAALGLAVPAEGDSSKSELARQQQYGSLSPDAQNGLLAEELRAEIEEAVGQECEAMQLADQQTQSWSTQEVLERDFQEIEFAVSCEAKASLDREYASAMDEAYDSLFEQLVASESKLGRS